MFLTSQLVACVKKISFFFSFDGSRPSPGPNLLESSYRGQTLYLETVSVKRALATATLFLLDNDFSHTLRSTNPKLFVKSP